MTPGERETARTGAQERTAGDRFGWPWCPAPGETTAPHDGRRPRGADLRNRGHRADPGRRGGLVAVQPLVLLAAHPGQAGDVRLLRLAPAAHPGPAVLPGRVTGRRARRPAAQPALAVHLR